MKERYYATFEYVDRYGNEIKELEIFSELGKAPSIGDYLEAFQKQGHSMEIKDFTRMTFKPTDPHNTPVISFRVVRAFKA
jgi:hypothetical protein